MNQFISNFRESLFEERNAKGIILFRIFVGIVLFFQSVWFIQTDFIQENFVVSKIHFPFSFFIHPISEGGMKFLLLLMLASSVGIITAKLYKLSVFIFGLTFTYLWLLDKSYFNNHYYFISLLVFLMFFIKIDKTVDVQNKSILRGTVTYWRVFLLKAQVFIVFFIAGIHKLNYYWVVEFQPMKHILETKAQVSNMDFLASNSMYAFFSWSGLIFDLSIGFLLWFKKTRKIGLVFFVAFNLLNFWLFYNIGEIGFFPFLLLACLPLFYFDTISDENIKEKTTKSKAVVFFIVTYMTLQVLLPFRYLLYSDHVDWTGNGQRFAWRMKIMYKEVDMHFYLIEEGSDKKLEVNVGNFLNDKQYTNLMYYPDFIPPVAEYIKSEGEKRGMKNPKVVADFKVGFMGHHKINLVDPDMDLTQINTVYGGDTKWILPLRH